MNNTVIIGIVVTIILICSSASSASVAFATKLPESSIRKQLLKIREQLPVSILERLPREDDIEPEDTEPDDIEPDDMGSTGSSSPSPVNCTGSWSGWSGCSNTCGGGTKTRTWTTTRQPAYGGTACPSPSTQSTSCNTQVCPSPSTPICTSLSNGNYYLTYHNGHKCVGLDDNIICGDSPDIGNDNKFYVECVGGKYTLKSLYNNKYCGGGTNVTCGAGNTTNPDTKFDIVKDGNYYNITTSIGEKCNYHNSWNFVCDNNSSNDKRFKFTSV